MCSRTKCAVFVIYSKSVLSFVMLSLLRRNIKVLTLLTCRLEISLDLNGKTVDRWKKINSTTAMFSLPHVWTPKSVVLCKLKGDRQSEIVNGLDLHGGRMYSWL